ncbi:MAG: efflux RND transporter periplasmic adaptor subunit [Defluviitaleaceae bacterium]|nr:efflux RND transporter periplasmic adaptor subunit [Defluviitaleaceae bacterium]
MGRFFKCASIAAAALTLAGCSLLPDGNAAAPKTSTSTVYRGDLVLGLMADGSITLPVTGLDFAVGGIISQIYVSPGDYVHKGDLLAELDDADLRIALKAAENNLGKALSAYDEALANADYNLKSELLSLENAKTQLEAEFDSYTYDLSINNASQSLARRTQEYEDALANAKTSEETAASNVEKRVKDADEAKAALSDAEADLASARAETAAAFDSYTYDNSVASAETQAKRTQKNYEDAVAELEKTKTSLKNELRSNDAAVKEAAEAAVASKEQTVYNAKNNYDDALASLEIAKTNRARAEADHAAKESDRIDNLIESAEKTAESAKKALENARQSVADAKDALDSAYADTEKKAASALQAVDDAKESLQNARNDLARARETFDDNKKDRQNSYELQVLRVENLTNADLSIQNAQFNIEEAKNALETAENNLSKVRITSPIDGEILNVTRKVGERVNQNDNSPGIFMGALSTSGSFITIRDVTEIYLTAGIPEGDIVGLYVGQSIRMEVDALNGQVLPATIYSISSIPSRDSSGIITYEVIGILDEFNGDIRDQMSVFMTFIKREIKDVPLIPNRSVFMEDGRQYVYVQKDDGSLEKRQVTCGFSNGTQTEVKSGLEIGETVVVGRVAA